MDYTILVNRENKLDEDYYEEFVKPSLVVIETYKNNEVVYQTFGIEEKKTYLEKKTAEKFEELRNFCLENNVYLGISSGFLTFEQQGRKYEYFVNRHGKEFAEKSACLPGYSEHNTGLALDCDIFRNSKWGGIALDSEGNINSDTAWLHSVLDRFGFILRYPSGKEHITKLKFEPWHIRYIGEELAGFLYKNNMTLEEYYENLNK